MKAVYIEWCDAISYQKKSWVDIEEAKEWAKNDNWIVKQLGFIIQETDKYILLASELTEVKGESPDLGGVIKIPTTWIIKRQNLKIKTR